MFHISSRPAALALTVGVPLAIAPFACAPSYDFARDANNADAGDAADAGESADAVAEPDAESTGIVSLSAGGNDSCFVRRGVVYCWGAQDAYGELGTGPSSAAVPRPRPIDGQSASFARADEVMISHPEANEKANFACARAGGEVFCWGFGESDQRGRSGNGAGENGPFITKVPFLSRVRQLAVGRFHACAIVEPGDPNVSNVYCWGSSFEDARGPRDGASGYRRVIGIPAMKFIATGGAFSCGITVVGSKIHCWGMSFAYRSGARPAGEADAGHPDAGFVDCLREEDCWPNVIVLPAGAEEPKYLSLGSAFACALTATGQVYCWGANDYGQLGTTLQGSTPCPIGAGQCSLVPVQPITGGARAVTTGLRHTCAITAEGNALCWGDDNVGQLGDRGGLRQYHPVAVLDPVTVSPMKVRSIAAGGEHTCAVTDDDSLYCWGAPEFESDGGASSTPVRIPF